VETQAALIGTERGIELHPKPAIDAHLSGIVQPRNPEDDLPLRLAQSFQDEGVSVSGVLGDNSTEGFEHLARCLVEFGFASIAAQNLIKDGLDR
jgi:hypothetical protein